MSSGSQGGSCHQDRPDLTSYYVHLRPSQEELPGLGLPFLPQGYSTQNSLFLFMSWPSHSRTC